MMSIDYGVVQYKFGPEPGTLTAIWREPRLAPGEVGTGLAVGGTAGQLAGDYSITYYAPDNSVDAVLDLSIKEQQGTYHVYWLKDGIVRCEGIGIAVEGGLSVGYIASQN